MVCYVIHVTMYHACFYCFVLFAYFMYILYICSTVRCSVIRYISHSSFLLLSSSICHYVPMSVSLFLSHPPYLPLSVSIPPAPSSSIYIISHSLYLQCE